jgi:hypothetical protein
VQEKTIVILQPGYLPWLGFFDQMSRSNIFVYYDDVQFDKRGWRNRNRIKSPNGPFWLTVPVFYKRSTLPLILDVQIDNSSNWVKKQLETVRQYYAKALYFDCYFPHIQGLLMKPWKYLIDLNLNTVDYLCGALGLSTMIHRSSELGITGGKTERLVNICKYFGATSYLTGDAAKSYLDLSVFFHAQVKVNWHNYQHPVYQQQFGTFVPFLSILDLLMNVGNGSLSLLRNIPKERLKLD